MKYKKIILLVSSLFLVAGCNKETPIDIKDIDIKEEVDDNQIFTVTVPTGNGFTFEGETSVKKGENYSFKIKAKTGYSVSDAEVKVNGQILPLNNSSYFYYNVQSNLNIEVSGVNPISRITVTNKKLFYKVGEVPASVKNEAYFISNAKGTYGTNSNAEIEVDISNVDFDNAGCYPVYYYLVDNRECYEVSSVCIMDISSSVSINIDLADVSAGGISSLYGQVFTDFDIKDSSGNKLTSNQIYFDASTKFNVFAPSYLGALSLGVQHSFTISYIGFDQNVIAKITLTDNEEPNFVFSHLNDEYTFIIENVIVPTATKNANSIQQIDVKYFVNGTEHTLQECKNILSNDGDYQYSIKLFRGNNELTSYTKNYLIHIVGDPNSLITFASSSSGRARAEVSNKGNIVIKNSGKGLDLNVVFNQNFMEKYNTQRKNILVLDLTLKTVESDSGQEIWFMDGKTVASLETPANRFDRFIDLHPTCYTGFDASKGFVVDSTIRVPLYVGGTRDDNVNPLQTCSSHLILRSFSGSIEITKFFFINNDEEINASSDFLSGNGSFASYTNVSEFINNECRYDDDISNCVVSFKNDFFEIKGDNLLSKLQSQDGYKTLEFDVSIESLDNSKTAVAVYAAHGGWAAWEPGCLELDNNHKAHISIDLTEYLFDINGTQNAGKPFVLFLRLYGSTTLNNSITLANFESSAMYIKPCKFVLSNFSLGK